MEFRHSATILPSANCIAKVTALAWSPNSFRLAAVTLTRIVYLFNELGELKDKFATKPANPKGSKLYIVTGMVFSPDSIKLAICQSDDIIYVYNLGSDWGDKKSICHKFHQPIPIFGIVWPSIHQNKMFFGLTDGKVKVGQLRTNKTSTVYAHGTGSPVISLACSPDGTSCLAGHLDGSIYRFKLETAIADASFVKLVNHGIVPVALAWGKNIVAAGPDFKVVFYDNGGVILQQFEFNHLEVPPDFTLACFNQNGDTVVLGCFNGFHVFSIANSKGMWEDFGQKKIQNVYTVSALAWKPDGSQLAVGSLCGNAFIYDAFSRRQCLKENSEGMYATNCQEIEATSVLTCYDMASDEDNFATSIHAAHNLMKSYDLSSESVHAMKELRDVLYYQVDLLKHVKGVTNHSVLVDFERLLIPVTLITISFACREQGLEELLAKLNISLLRYIDMIPADKAFYEAGMSCKQINWQKKAFVYLNQYLDIAEAIDDHDSKVVLDFQAFEGSDIPHSFPVPKEHYVDKHGREEIRDWVIQFSLSQQGDQVLLTRKCENCSSSIYEASLVCFSCQNESQACCVTGYPVKRDSQIECAYCLKIANKTDWNIYIQAVASCPWCNTFQQPLC